MKNIFYCGKIDSINILIFIIFAFSISKVSADTIYYIPEGSIGTAPSTSIHPSFAACIGSISNNLYNLLVQCHGLAPDGHVENKTNEYYRRIWNKLGVGSGSINAGIIRIPYELRYIRDNSLSTNYKDIVSYDSKNCPDEGCYITTFGEDDEPPTACVGNPIDPAKGEKLQTEIDIQDNVKFYRYYHSTEHTGVMGKSWGHSFDHSLSYSTSQLTKPKRQKFRSIPYNTKIDACTKGWDDIKKRLNASWVSSTVANYDSPSNTCLIQNGNTIVAKTFPISTNYIFSDNKYLVQLNRANGTILSFEEVNTSIWRPLGNHTGQLIKQNDGIWNYVSHEGIIEKYSLVGKLISVVYPNGTVLNLNYDNKRQLQNIGLPRFH